MRFLDCTVKAAQSPRDFDNAMSALDLMLFQEYFELTVQPIIDYNGNVFPQFCPSNYNCQEGNTDAQYIMGIAQNITTTFWHTPPNITTNAFYEWVLTLEDDPNPPLVNSASFASIEATTGITV
jgi:hypothetical protein